VKVRRVMKMGLSEVAGRSRQQLWKGLERIGALNHTHRPVWGAWAPGAIRAEGADGDHAGARSMQLDRFRRAAAARFFAGTADAEVSALLAERLPGAREQIIESAQSILQGRFDVLGYRGLSFGDPVDWHLDPISGRRAPLLHWSRIDPLDSSSVGDSKVIWELNRHQWLVRLGQAYQLTGDERYAACFATSVDGWLRANPSGCGINWASSLELSLRLIAWCWAVILFRGSPALSPELFAAVRQSVRAHAAHVERYLSYYFSPNTHLTGEALGLFYAGVVFPELTGAHRWRRLGRRILIVESERQVLADGVHFERATCYQRYTAEIYLHFLLLAERTQIPVPPAVRERFARLLDFLVAMGQPDGALPHIGDADGGWLLPLAARGPDDVRGILAAAASICGRSDFAWAAQGWAPEALWLLGRAGITAFDALAPSPPAGPESRLFSEGGYAIMRSAWDRGAHQLVFDVGPLGCPVSAGHGHADLLSIQCAAFGEPYLVDPGTYCYTADRAWRDFFRSTSAHSTVMVDGRSQARPHGPFGWHEQPRAALTSRRSTDALDVVDAQHAAYRDLDDPVVHRRRVLWVKPRYWVIVDDLLGVDEHRVELRFQFAPLNVTIDEALWTRARGARGHGLLLHPFTRVGLQAQLFRGEAAPIQGWVSPDYGQRRPAPVVVYSAVATLPLRIATLVLPIEDSLAITPLVSSIDDDGAGPLGLSVDGGREVVRFGPREEVTVGRPGVMENLSC
jgi:Heparinase II/III-like protein/Heparinase II/III N-terminus